MADADLRRQRLASSTSEAGIEGDTPVTASARSPSTSAAAAATNVLSTPAENATMAEPISPRMPSQFDELVGHTGTIAGEPGARGRAPCDA